MNSLIHGYQRGQIGIIEISVQIEDDWLHLEYRDNGVGIPAEYLPKIFDPFFTTNRGEGGSGLGLNIIYNIITSTFKGGIECTSIVNEGVFFRIDLLVSE